MDTILEVIHGQSLLITTLTVQLVNAGGSGYNSTVQSDLMPNSFSVVHTFLTPDGFKQLITPNEYMVGIVNEERTHYVYFVGESQSFELRTFNGFDDDSIKQFTVTQLGNTFDQMMAQLKTRWPNRIVWNMCDPKIALNR
ncbi:hypothetical protein [Pseudoalteromonas prydzensis]|uniref:hypothetical protein n=1 Tax=Pseudoalteromonas prydzensis TaxID=182141 RepID=UPI003FD5F6F8